jgi:hypothetical protein
MLRVEGKGEGANGSTTLLERYLGVCFKVTRLDHRPFVDLDGNPDTDEFALSRPSTRKTEPGGS